MKFQSIGTLNKSLNVQDLAAIISEDAMDTYSKFGEMLAEFTNLDSLSNCVNDTSQVAITCFNEIWYYLNTTCEGKVSMVMNDGDVLWIYTDTDGEGLHSYNRVLYKSRNDPEGTIILECADNHYVTGYATAIKDISGSFTWSFEEIMSSLGESMNSSLLVHRLSSLMQQDSITVSDIMSVTSDLPCNAGSDLSTFMSRLRDLGTNIMPSTILRMIQGTYTTIANTTVSGDTIEWNENAYTMRGYAGTIIKSVLATAAQVVGSILVYGGNLILKIAGATILAVGYVASAIWNGMTTVAGEKAVYKPLADQNEFPMPIWQHQFLASRDSIEALCTELSNDQVYKLNTDSINYYLWLDGDNVHCNVEAYLTTSFKGARTNKMSLQRHNLGTYYNGGIFSRIFYVTPSTNPYWTMYNGSFDFDPDNPTLANNKLGDILNDTEYMPGNLKRELSQAEMKQCLTNVLYLTVAQACMAYHNDWDGETADKDYHLLAGNRIYDYCSDCGTILNEPDYDQHVFTIPDYTGLNNWTVLKYFLWNASGYKTIIDSVNNSINTYSIEPEDISWIDMLNKVIPALKDLGLTKLFRASIGSLIDDHEDEDHIWASYSSYACIQESTSNTGIFKPSHFRNNYEITPPSQEPGTLLKVLVITAAVTVAVTTVVIATKSIIKRALRTSFTKAYSEIAALQAEIQADPTNTTKIKQMSKLIRKYNFKASLFGYSTLSFVNGWENGDAASSDGQILGSNTGVLDTVAEQMTGVFDNAMLDAQVIVSDGNVSVVSSLKGSDTTNNLTELNNEVSSIKRLIK